MVVIKECENQSNGLYLKKWPLTTIEKTNPGKTFCSSGLWHIPPQSSNSLPKLVKIMEKNMNHKCSIVYFIQSTIKKGKQLEKKR